MTEIPMPGDYGAPERQPPPAESKGCCQQICECWLYLLLAGVIIFIIIMILFIFPMMGFIDFFGF
jgi:hypothetical protein